MKKIEVVIKKKLKNYKGLDTEFTQVANSMIREIKNPSQFKIYVYLCSLYNKDFDYAFPSLSKIAEDCSISLKTVKNSIKALCDAGYIKKGKYKNDSGWNSNIYYIRYVIEERIEKEIEIEGEEDEQIIIIGKDTDDEEEVIDIKIEYKDLKK